MSRSNGSDNGGSGQRTVAELLAMYGDSAPAPSSGRRRRRRDDEEPAASPVTTRDADDDFERPTPAPPRRSRSHAVDPPTPPELRYDPLGVDALLGAGRPQPVDDDDAPTQFDIPVVDEDVTLTQPHMFPPDLSPGTETDQIPTAGGAFGPDSTAAMPIPVDDDAIEDHSSADGREALDLAALAPRPATRRHRPARSVPDHVDDDLEPTSETEFDLHDDHRDDDWNDHDWSDDTDEPRQHTSPLKEWGIVVAQVGIGIVGGAALWLICEWLWQSLPVVALVVALGVITGLVWVVRKVRRAEDLQTTLVAVLVGLFVTVSPAALLLVDK